MKKLALITTIISMMFVGKPVMAQSYECTIDSLEDDINHPSTTVHYKMVLSALWGDSIHVQVQAYEDPSVVPIKKKQKGYDPSVPIVILNKSMVINPSNRIMRGSLTVPVRLSGKVVCFRAILTSIGNPGVNIFPPIPVCHLMQVDNK